MVKTPLLSELLCMALFFELNLSSKKKCSTSSVKISAQNSQKSHGYAVDFVVCYLKVKDRFYRVCFSLQRFPTHAILERTIAVFTPIVHALIVSPSIALARTPMLEMGQPAAVRIQMLESVPSCLIFVNYPFFLVVHSLHRDFPRLSWRFPRQGRKDSRPTSPAISDIWLGIRTVPVPSVAKESRGASQIAHWPRSARTQAGRCGPTDRRSSVKKLLSFVRLLMFPSLLEEITGH